MRGNRRLQAPGSSIVFETLATFWFVSMWWGAPGPPVKNPLMAQNSSVDSSLARRYRKTRPPVARAVPCSHGTRPRNGCPGREREREGPLKVGSLRKENAVNAPCCLGGPNVGTNTNQTVATKNVLIMYGRSLKEHVRTPS